MNPQKMTKELNSLSVSLKKWLKTPEQRLGLISSVNGQQLITLCLNTTKAETEFWETEIQKNSYPSLTQQLPLCHWFERLNFDLFGIIPEGHPRFKHVLLHEEYEPGFFPLRKNPKEQIKYDPCHRQYQFMQVEGDEVYEIPVGPIHAGIIEPGHFRFSCLGEIIINLEIHLGYLHRGIEKRICEVPIQQVRFVVEAAATDTSASNALAHARAFESINKVTIPQRAILLRSLALESERIANHITDLIGLAGDIGLIAVAANYSVLRGQTLSINDWLSGNRFLRSFIVPGGISRDPCKNSIIAIKKISSSLLCEIEKLTKIFLSNQVVEERMCNVGSISKSLAEEFAFVGPTARACGITYDARQCFSPTDDPARGIEVATAKTGDVMARAQIRFQEVLSSLKLIIQICDLLEPGPYRLGINEFKELETNAIGVSIVESPRGELIHLAMTDENGKISRYIIKDPSINNWTALSIAVRNNLLADFPLCNKSFSLSYGGHDL